MKYPFYLFIIIMFSCATKSLESIDKFDNSRSFQFSYKVDIGSTNGEKLELWLPIPQSNEVQEISNLQIITNGLQYSIELENVHGNKYLYIDHLSGTTTITTITMTFDVTRKEHKNIKYKNIDPEQYLDPYTMVPVGSIFEKIIIDNNLSTKNIRGIYDFVFEGMHYAKPKSEDDKYYKEPWLSPNEKYGMKEVGRDNIVSLYQKSKKENGSYTFGNGNAIYACDIGVGNCTDYHSYFLSLDRTIGIPARFHMGFSIPNEESGEIDGYHCWADYYVKGEGWYPVDISEADKVPSKKDYFFGTVCENRVEMIIGRDIVLKGYESKITNLFIYPIMEINDEKSIAFTKYFSYNNI